MKRWKRQPALTPLPAERPEPRFELIKVRQGEEVAHARAEARTSFEQRLVAAQRRPPTPEQMDTWWPDAQG